MMLFLAFGAVALSMGHLYFAGFSLAFALFLSPTVTVGKQP